MPNTADGKSRSLAASRSIGELLGGGAGKNIEGARGRLWACDVSSFVAGLGSSADRDSYVSNTCVRE